MSGPRYAGPVMQMKSAVAKGTDPGKTKGTDPCFDLCFTELVMQMESAVEKQRFQ